MASHMKHKIGDIIQTKLRDGSFKGEVLVVSSKQCQHSETICSNCLEQWRHDHILTNVGI